VTLKRLELSGYVRKGEKGSQIIDANSITSAGGYGNPMCSSWMATVSVNNCNSHHLAIAFQRNYQMTAK
jgi:hypothetical protein